jgi:hypothetical protein
MNTQTPDWIREGAHVAEYNRRGLGFASYTEAVIARVTATQIVLDNGGKYRIKDLRQVGAGFYRYPELVPLTDRRVRDAQASSAVNALRHQIDDLWKQSEARTVDSAVERLAEVEALVAEARAVVEQAAKEG